MTQPLVSILIPNYNYGKYLPECLDSVLNQTYSHIECVICDNASTDNSWEIIQNYKEKFEKRGFIYKTFRNRQNYGSSFNSKKCAKKSKGEYVYYLCSDDSIEPTFIEKGINAFDLSDNISLVIFNRNDMDEFGEKTPAIPFYNTSCIIPGEAQAAVFMMTNFSVLSQVIHKREKSRNIKRFVKDFRFAGDWHLNFRMCMVGDAVFLNEPLFNYRTHNNSESAITIDDMSSLFESFIVLNDFVNIAHQFKKESPVKRYDDAVKKLGDIALRYSYNALKQNNFETARKYLTLSLVFDYDLLNSETYKILYNAIFNNTYDNFEKLEIFSKRQVSYDPPEGYIEISI